MKYLIILTTGHKFMANWLPANLKEVIHHSGIEYLIDFQENTSFNKSTLDWDPIQIEQKF